MSPHTAVPFGQYLLLKRLAVGGMAELYLAKDTKKDRLIVIKRILPYLAQEREFVQMFLDEARIASQLHHPNIITVYELGHLEGSIFIAMEYVDGVDLRKIFNEEQKHQRTVPPNITAWLVSRLCDGLHYAHNRAGQDGKPMGIIHRDVSPQNLMVGYGGVVKLVDFGIAKAGALMERSKPGVIKGKFLYLSPEQLSQERIDHRADIFALGTMMYEVTVGKSPFYKATTEAVIYAIRAEEPPPPHLTRRDFPMQLSKIIMRCLVKDRTRRYQQAGEVHADLEEWIKTEAPTTADDVRSYVARVFGNEEERTSLFIPPNARGPSDRATDRLAAARHVPTTESIRVQRPAPPAKDEPTSPIGTGELASQPSPSAITSPIGRRPTPEPVRAVEPTTNMRQSSQALKPVGGAPRSGGPAPVLSAEPSTQTARPQDLARNFNAGGAGEQTSPTNGNAPARASGAVTKLPERKPTAQALRQAGATDPTTDPTSGSQTGRGPQDEGLMRTPITADVKPARLSQPGSTRQSSKQLGPIASVPEGIRQTKQPPPPATREGPRVSKSVSERSVSPERVATAAAVAPKPAVRKPTRGETGAVLDVPAQFARDEIPRGRVAGAASVPAPNVPTLPPEPSTKRDRPGSRPSQDDLGPLLDRAIPSLAGGIKAVELADDPDDAINTKDMSAFAVQMAAERSVVPAESQLDKDDDRDDDRDADKDDRASDSDDEAPPGFLQKPWAIAAIVFFVVLALGLGLLGVLRARGRHTIVPVADKTAPDKVPDKVAEKGKPAPEVKPAADPKPPDTATAPAAEAAKHDDPLKPPPAPPSGRDIPETETALVRLQAIDGTKLMDQRDETPLTANTPYRWRVGTHPIIYSCPVKGPKARRVFVTAYVDVKAAPPEQTFPISCK